MAPQVTQRLKLLTNSIEGMPILIAAETICLHGDNPKAARIAKLLVDTLRDNGVNISKSGAKRD
ncbi:MAG: LamB/YcsF family protein [Kangiellaceae bacterium]|nr:LamB/YcsF family protein [Kangiellaceae bacterium]